MTFEEWWNSTGLDVGFEDCVRSAARDAWDAAWESGFKQCRGLINTTGYVLVPVEPTENMWLAGRSELLEHYPSADEVYKAMIKAAQEEE